MSEDLSSTTQDSWAELAGALRMQIVKSAGLAPAMTPSEIGELVDAARNLYWLEIGAATFDKEVELRLARVTAGD